MAERCRFYVLHGSLVVKFDPFNDLLSSVHIISVIRALFIKNKCQYSLAATSLNVSMFRLSIIQYLLNI